MYCKKTLINFRMNMIVEMDALAAKEHRNRSELVREAVRQYMYNAKIKEGRINESRNEVGSSIAQEVAICR